MPKKPSITQSEIEYIVQNAATKSDRQIAKELDRDIRTIKKYRSKAGIIKSGSGKIKKLQIEDIRDNKVVNRKLSEKERKQFFKTELQNSLFYENLKSQFTDTELDFYLEEWGALCLQFEDIVTTERRQIDELIKTEIMGNRILRNIKIAEDVILEVQQEVELLREVKDMEEDEDAQERDNSLISMIRTMSSQSQGMVNDYGKNQDARNKLLDNLNARRRDRIDQIQKSGLSFIEMMKMMNENKIKEEQGQYIEMLKMSKDKKKELWRDPGLFPDGTKDCVLLDDKSNIPNENVVLTETNKVDFILDLLKLEDKLNIAIVASEQFSLPSSIFSINHKHNITNIHTLKQLKKEVKVSSSFDYVIFSYALDDNRDCVDAARIVVDNGLFIKCKGVIVGDEEFLNDQIENILLGYIEVQKCKWDLIDEMIGDNNA